MRGSLPSSEDRPPWTRGVGAHQRLDGVYHDSGGRRPNESKEAYLQRRVATLASTGRLREAEEFIARNSSDPSAALGPDADYTTASGVKKKVLELLHRVA